MNKHALNQLSKSVISAFTGVVLLSATLALADSDAFNRPKLGGNWIITSGTLSISDHGMVGDSLSLGYLTAMRNDTAASAVLFLNGTDLQYGAVAVGDIASGNNAFVKIQEQDGTGMFEYAGFYTSNNVGGYFFTLAEPVPSPAILDVSFSNTTTATMRITSAAGEQTYTFDYGTMFGPGGGLGTYGPIRLDNFLGFQSDKHGTAGGIPATRMPRATDLSLVR